MAVSVIPERSLTQRRDALGKANLIRTTRAEMKRDVKARRREVTALILDPPWWLESMKVFDLLMASPKIGRVKANKILGFARVAPSKQVGGLSERQRTELVSLLRLRR